MNIIIQNITTQEMDLYHTYTDAADHLGISSRTLSRNLKNGNFHYLGWICSIPHDHKAIGKRRNT